MAFGRILGTKMTSKSIEQLDAFLEVAKVRGARIFCCRPGKMSRVPGFNNRGYKDPEMV